MQRINGNKNKIDLVFNKLFLLVHDIKYNKIQI